MYIYSILLVLFVFLSPSLAEEFILNKDGSVTGLSSGLVWQGQSISFDTAHEAAAFCEQTPSNNASQWRLPTYTELASLDATLQVFNPALYWASNSSPSVEGIYCFGDGAFFSAAELKTDALVRCVSESPIAPVVEAVSVWVESWQNGDILGYLSAYTSDFQPQSNIVHTAWEKKRRQRLSSAAEIVIELETEEINSLDDTLVEIIFLQDYRSRHYQDRVRKRLLLTLQQGRWLIAKEEQLSSLPRETLSSTATYYR